jgi:REP element-mobilizing transposase RayT
LPRICPIGIAQHIIQRGNNRQICFDCEQDFFAYVGGLKEFSVKCSVDTHARVLMTNHVHLLCTPHEAGGVRVNLTLF